ncbi:DUF4266 domain-containing protein [Sulfurimonas sp. MAG313]|nr:DUF4266 domain-containing protein [Sulfurimonas sp. MAG313]MDF1880405.1 DUF4266 domain-containing protein [Sulfurimonas sp. MAG313]
MKYLLISLSIFILAGCSHVAPYEKEALAEQKMLASPMTTRSAFDAHVFSIREGSFGAESGFSGGCGCK